MRGHIALVLLVLCAGLMIAPAAAEEAVIIDEDIAEDGVDTSVSYAKIARSGAYVASSEMVGYDCLQFHHIELAREMYYVVITLTQKTPLPEGSTTGTYTLNGDTKTCQYFVEKSIGSGSKISIFFDDWDVDALVGEQTVQLSHTYMIYDSRAQSSYSESGPESNIHVWRDPAGTYHTPTQIYYIAYSTRTYWKNHLKVIHKSPENPLSGLPETYDIYLTRGDQSVITLYSAEDALLLTQTSTEDYQVEKLISAVDHIKITSLIPNTYTYTLSEYASPPAAAGFSLSLSSDTAMVGDALTATLIPDADAPRYSEISYGVTDPDGSTAYTHYSMTDTWDAWTVYNKTSKLNEPCTEADALTVALTPTGAGTWTVSATVRDRQPPSTGAALAEVAASCEVSRPAGTVDVEISIYDGARSSPTYLSGVGLTVKDLTAGGTVLYDSCETYLLGDESGTCDGLATVSAPQGDEIEITAERNGYVSQTWTEVVRPTAIPLNVMPIKITLSPAATPAPDEIYVSISVETVNHYAIEGATVSAAGHVAQTNSLGACRLRLPTNSTVRYTVSAPRYTDTSGYILTGAVNTQATIYLYPSATPRPTPPPGGGEPGADSTPDYRTADEKAESALNILFDNVETFAGLAVIVLMVNMLFWIMPSGGRRR